MNTYIPKYKYLFKLSPFCRNINQDFHVILIDSKTGHKIMAEIDLEHFQLDTGVG